MLRAWCMKSIRRNVMKNGLVIIRVGGNVYMKIATSADGTATAKVEKTVRSYGKIPLINAALTLARRGGFKNESHLAIITKDGSLCGDRLNNRVATVCRKTFDDLNFNPIWDDGRNDFIAIVDF